MQMSDSTVSLNLDESTLLELPPLPRGRPSAAVLEERARLAKIVAENKKRIAAEQNSITDTDLLETINYRFQMLNRFAIAAAAGEIRCLVAHGSGGIGKSFEMLKTLDEVIPGEYEVIEGGNVSPVHLYMAGYRNKEPGRVLVFDDADAWFSGGSSNEELLNLLKKMTDTTPRRRMTYMKASPVLEAEGIPNEYEFEGSVIFLSNVNFEKLAEGSDRRANHMQAIQTRALVLDLQIHSIRAKYVWVRQRAQEAILPSLKATAEETERVMQYLNTNYERFKALSLRSVGNLLTIIRGNPLEWEKDANIMLLRS